MANFNHSHLNINPDGNHLQLEAKVLSDLWSTLGIWRLMAAD
jgi:hypothetical protein